MEFTSGVVHDITMLVWSPVFRYLDRPELYDMYPEGEIPIVILHTVGMSAHREVQYRTAPSFVARRLTKE